LGAIINVITRSGQGARRLAVLGEARTSANWLGRAIASATQGPFELFLSGSVNGASDYPSWLTSPTLGSVTPALRVNSDYERLNGFMQASFALGSARPHRAHAQRGRRRLRIASQASSPIPPIRSRSGQSTIAPVDLNGLAAQLGASYDLGAGWSARGWLYRNVVHSTTDRYPNANLDPGQHPDRSRVRRVTSLGPWYPASVRNPASGHTGGTLTLGLSAERDVWQQTLQTATTAVAAAEEEVVGCGVVVALHHQPSSRPRPTRHCGATVLALEYGDPAEPPVGESSPGIMHDWLDGDGPSDQATGYSAGHHLRCHIVHALCAGRRRIATGFHAAPVLRRDRRQP
jgi:hypothetical protein